MSQEDSREFRCDNDAQTSCCLPRKSTFADVPDGRVLLGHVGWPLNRRHHGSFSSSAVGRDSNRPHSDCDTFFPHQGSRQLMDTAAMAGIESQRERRAIARREVLGVGTQSFDPNNNCCSVLPRCRRPNFQAPRRLLHVRLINVFLLCTLCSSPVHVLHKPWRTDAYGQQAKKRSISEARKSGRKQAIERWEAIGIDR